MKRLLILVLVLLLVGSVALAGEAYEKEILFRGTPWGISYTEADKLWPEYKIYDSLTGEMMRFYPTLELYSGSYDMHNNPEYHDINIPAPAWNGQQDVAGYKTSGVQLHFAYTVIDGVITHNSSDTRMYGAQYKFEPADSNLMVEDLTKKLTGLYGDIDEEGSDPGYAWDYYWWIWKGANNTAVAITLQDDKDSEQDEVWISYFTYDGDKWLYEASDGEKERLLREQQAGASSGNVDGL